MLLRCAPVKGRPEPTEHVPYYAGYIGLVPGEDVLAAFESETPATRALLEGIPAEKSLHRYAPGKWSIRESVLHVVDCERAWAYRALRFGRADETPLAGFDSNAWVPPSLADDREWRSIVEEYAAVRSASIALFRGLPPDARHRSGTADGKRTSVRALAYVILGHDIHHRNVLRDRYL
jgi:uncharacterized damage-inducible protein DinB